MADGADWRQVAHRIGDQTVILGDCRDVMARMEPGSVDVVVTSPPYNLSLAYHVYDDSKTEEDYIAWLAEVAIRVKDVLKPDGSFFLNIAGSPSQPLLPHRLALKMSELFVLQNTIHWIKSIAIDDYCSRRPAGDARVSHPPSRSFGAASGEAAPPENTRRAVRIPSRCRAHV